MIFCKPVRMLDRAPDRDAIAFGRRHECVGLDGEVVTIGNE